ncbi:hypothetical protein [Gemmata obscuriglobus]|uniref:hypothetical protein n=1 Tax=Gemmata obscuriglobus TaxID=114 RepID=UPI0011CDD990|nr:hypothetical protein [Gemmata obscuriglobus]
MAEFPHDGLGLARDAGRRFVAHPDAARSEERAPMDFSQFLRAAISHKEDRNQQTISARSAPVCVQDAESSGTPLGFSDELGFVL